MADYPDRGFFADLIAETDGDEHTPRWPFTREAFGLGHSPVETGAETVPHLPASADALNTDGPLVGVTMDPVNWQEALSAAAGRAWEQAYLSALTPGPLFTGDPTPTGTMPITTLVLRARKATNGFEPETEAP